jgi:UDP-N-acetylglucosamine 2-epimerase
MKVVTIVGARPQFIKSAPVSKVLREAGHQEFLVHTGQHYDYGMSQIFFDELALSEPNINLGVGSGSHGKQTGEMLIGIEQVLLDQKPDWVLVYGDTNSTLAGALAAVKLHIPLAHVEAGLRSYNPEMPEEHNRVLTDHCANLLFCPTQNAVLNLANEGIKKGVHWVGDTMYDAVLQYTEIAKQRSKILKDLGLQAKSYFLATVHRAYNTDNPHNLGNIMAAFHEIDEQIIFPIHPRTRAVLESLNIPKFENTRVQIIPAVGYLDMLVLEQNARLILTDSGGIQKEAYFYSVPCVTLRPETEWVETVETGWNLLVSADSPNISQSIRSFVPPILHPMFYGNGQSALSCVELMNSK